LSSPLLRVGVIGCGFFADNQLAAWASMKDVTIAAVCDLDPSKARAAAAKFGAGAAYQDAAEMLATEHLDFVDIITTMRSHAALVRLVAERKLPVVVQKPLAPSWEECVAIVEVARAAGIPLMVHENVRFQTPMRRAREVIDSGVLGSLTWARISYRTGFDVYDKQPYLATEENYILLDLGVHMLDVTRYLLGEVTHLYCQSQSVKPGIRGEDMATIMLRHASGVTSVVECSYASHVHPDPFPQTALLIEGTRGSLRIDPGYRMSVFSEGNAEERDVSPHLYPWSTPPWHGTQEAALRTQQHWVASLRQGTEPETSGSDALKTYGLVFGAYASARSGLAVEPLRWGA
jgi:predicted dehydrogenase